MFIFRCSLLSLLLASTTLCAQHQDATFDSPPLSEETAIPRNSPYHLSLRRELLYGGGGVGAVLGGNYLWNRVGPVDYKSVEMFAIGGVDNLNFYYDGSGARALSDNTKRAALYLPALLLLHRDTRRDAGKIGLLFGEALLINHGLTNITKATVKRPRPYLGDPRWDRNQPLLVDDRASFLSGHTSGTAVGSFFFASVFSDYFPDSKLKPYVWTTAIALPALTGYLRVRAARHYPTDVIAGYALGATIGYFVPKLHKRPLLKGKLKVLGGPGGVSMRLHL